tara:strand:+ start:121 stop:1389 length:1269 start_codon:yes stop_codon:yes gene_type:complete
MSDSLSTYARFYQKRDNYNLYPTNGIQPIDIHYEKLFYGKVDTKQNSVMVKSLDFLKVVSPGSNVVALDFVAEAFRDLQEHFSKAVAFKRLANYGELHQGITPTNGYVNINLLYANHLTNMSEVFNLYLLASENHRKVKKYTDFLTQFLAFIDTVGDEFVFTKTAFIRSKLCPVNVSGLVIDISDDEFSDDDTRQTWLEDPNFNFYRTAAAYFGFLLDRSAPWRLYANVASKEMQSYWATKSDSPPHRRALIQTPGDASNLFDVYYLRSHNYELEQFESMLIDFYDRFLKESPSFTISEMRTEARCIDSSAVEKKTFFREPITLQAAQAANANILMKAFFRARLREEGLHKRMSQQKFDRFARYANRLMKKVDKFAAMRYINNKIKNLNSLKESENLMACQNYESCDQVNKSSLVDYTYVKD